MQKYYNYANKMYKFRNILLMTFLIFITYLSFQSIISLANDFKLPEVQLKEMENELFNFSMMIFSLSAEIFLIFMLRKKIKHSSINYYILMIIGSLPITYLVFFNLKYLNSVMLFLPVLGVFLLLGQLSKTLEDKIIKLYNIATGKDSKDSYEEVDLVFIEEKNNVKKEKEKKRNARKR